jgi:hypothetical protein
MIKLLETIKGMHICQNHGSNWNKNSDENAVNSSTLVVSSQGESVTCNIGQDIRISDRQPDCKFVLPFLILCFCLSSVNVQRTHAQLVLHDLQVCNIYAYFLTQLAGIGQSV